MALPAKAGHVADVDRIAAAFVIDVAQNRFHELRTRIELIPNGDIESALAGEIPTRRIHGFGFQREAGAISIVGRTRDMILRGENDLVRAFAPVA